MNAKFKEREKAIKLRRKGLSYREILEQVPAAKSSLSLWLRGVKLAKRQKQRLTEKKIASALRGSRKWKEIRIDLTRRIKDQARKEIGRLSKREVWLIGTALYWAEGTKEKEHKPGSGAIFSNSDTYMIKLYLKWLLNILKIPKENIYFAIYLHENHKHRSDEVKKYWQTRTNFPIENFRHIYFKKHKIHTKRKNIGQNYFGLLKIAVMESSILNRKIQGWIEGIYQNSGVV